MCRVDNTGTIDVTELYIKCVNRLAYLFSSFMMVMYEKTMDYFEVIMFYLFNTIIIAIIGFGNMLYCDFFTCFILFVKKTKTSL